MPISGNVPEHLVVGARTGFLAAVGQKNYAWQKVAGIMNMNARSIEMVDLGAAPMPMEDRGGKPLQDFVERMVTVKPRNWHITVSISYNAVQDDQTGQLENKVKAAAENFQRHINKLVFQALNAGDGSTYGLAYDGLSFFNDSHVDKGAAYSTVQDNNFALALSLDNFTTNLNLAHAFKDDQGEYTDHMYDLLVVPPALEYIAAQICGNVQAYDTANREANPYSGKFSYVVSPYLDATAWVISASGQIEKPIYLAMRENPILQDFGFDSGGPDGGLYWFKFYSRYNIFYGDWRLAALGNT